MSLVMAKHRVPVTVRDVESNGDKMRPELDKQLLLLLNVFLSIIVEPTVSASNINS
jgi:hypothetical protein